MDTDSKESDGMSEIYQAIFAGDSFVSGNMAGRNRKDDHSINLYGSGRAEGHAKALWWDDRPNVDYVVFSYNTPIAWRIDRSNGMNYWTIPDAKYSATTTRHQRIVRTALHTAGLEYREE